MRAEEARVRSLVAQQHIRWVCESAHRWKKEAHSSIGKAADDGNFTVTIPIATKPLTEHNDKVVAHVLIQKLQEEGFDVCMDGINLTVSWFLP